MNSAKTCNIYSNDQKKQIILLRFGAFDSTKAPINTIPEISEKLGINKPYIESIIFNFRKTGCFTMGMKKRISGAYKKFVERDDNPDLKDLSPS